MPSSDVSKVLTSVVSAGIVSSYNTVNGIKMTKLQPCHYT